MAEIYAVKLGFRIRLFEKDQWIAKHIPEETIKRLLRFRKWEDAERTLMGEILIRTIAREKLKISHQDIRFDKNEYHKPFLKNVPHFHFNLSHAGEWVVCAVDEVPVGVDIEKIQPIDLSIAKRFFSKLEHDDLMAKPHQEKIDYFYVLWTLKESYVKAKGEGLSIPLHSFSFQLDEQKNVQMYTSRDRIPHFFRLYDIDSCYKLAVCSQSPLFAEKVVMREYDEILTSFQAINP